MKGEDAMENASVRVFPWGFASNRSFPLNNTYSAGARVDVLEEEEEKETTASGFRRKR